MSHKLYLGSVAQVDGSAMTIGSGKQLNVVDAPTSDNNAANKKYVDLKSKEVQDALNLVIAGSDVNYDTLLEIKNLSDNIASTGAGDVIAKVAAEKGERLAADDVLTAAVSAEVVNRDAAVSTEVSNRNTAISSAVSTEVSNRNTAISSAVLTETNNRVSGDAKLDMLAIKSLKTMLYSPYASVLSSVITPLELCSYTDPYSQAINFDGWRMRNNVALSKFTVYIPPSLGLKVGDIKAMYLELCAPSVVSMPFITIYTTKKNDGLDYVPTASIDGPNPPASWYRSKATYIRNDTDTLVAGSVYNMVTNLKGVDTFNPTYFTRHDTKLDTYSSRNYLVNMQDTDNIMYITISSDSSSAVGNVECIISKFKLQLESGINEFVFSNTHVFANYMKQRQSQLWNALYGTSSTDDPFMTPAFTIPVSYDGR